MNKYLAKRTSQLWKKHLDYLIHPSFTGVDRLFVLSSKDADGREFHKQCYLSTVEIKDHNVIIWNGRNILYQAIEKYLKTSDKIRKIATGKGDDYTTGCLLDYPYF